MKLEITAKKTKVSYKPYRRGETVNVDPEDTQGSVLAANTADDAEYLDVLCDSVAAELERMGWYTDVVPKDDYIVITLYRDEYGDDILDRYIQPVADIVPEWDAIPKDAHTLAIAAIEDVAGQEIPEDDTDESEDVI